jgi:hypothetical protein
MVGDVIRTALLRAPRLSHEITDYNAVISLCENRHRAISHAEKNDDEPRDDACLYAVSE